MNIFKKFFKIKDSPQITCGGVVEDYRMDNYNEIIDSDNIVSFEYKCEDYHLKCDFEDNKVHIVIKNKDNKELDYISNNSSILSELNNIIKEKNISKDNGHVHKVAGILPGLGDTICVLYDNSQKIYKTSNQFHNVNDEVGLEIYDLFKKNAIENGYNIWEDEIDG